MLRVIAGRYRGLQLEAPDGHNTRPITDRVKESLFNVLGSRLGTLAELPEFRVLDLFAGTGSLGIEALSRGAAHCLFVERDRIALRVLQANLARLKTPDVWRVLSANAWGVRLPRADAPDGRFGLIFVDPPYRDAAEVLRLVDLLERLAPHMTPDGLIVFRHSADTDLPEQSLRGLRRVDLRAYGDMRIELLALRATNRFDIDEPPPTETSPDAYLGATDRASRRQWPESSA